MRSAADWRDLLFVWLKQSCCASRGSSNLRDRKLATTDIRIVSLLHHPHHLNLLTTAHGHQNPAHLPISLQHIKRHASQGTPHLKPAEPLLHRCTLCSLKNQAP